MKTVLTTLNSKYIQTSLALRSIRNYAAKEGVEAEVCEYTINEDTDFVVAALVARRAEVYGFSCYVFNIEKTRVVIRNLKKVLPEAVVFVGGPEVSFECEAFLRRNPEVDYIARGEGERTDTELLKAIRDGKDPLCVAGVCGIRDGAYRQAEDRPVICPMDEIPFAYSDDEQETLKNKILYYESSRGCPFSCTYCMSSLDRGVRSLSMKRIFEDLTRFIRHGVRQVKLVDRTFNYDRARAREIIRFLEENDNGITNFHFEISADLIDDETVSLLRRARKGLFQLEVGIQSTNTDTQRAIRRNVPFERIRDKIKALTETPCAVHVDLIAGLPYENYQSFRKSFNDVYPLYADELALGFLKVLKGAPISYEAEHGNVRKEEPPYEVLYNRYITYGEMRRLKKIETILELYDNSHLCRTAIHAFMKKSGLMPFDFYDGFSDYLSERSFFDCSHALPQLFDFLYAYGVTVCKDEGFCENMLAYDLYGLDKLSSRASWIKTVAPDRALQHELMREPDCFIAGLPEEIRRCLSALPRGSLFRNTELVPFAYDEDGEPQEVVVLFIYGKNRRRTPLRISPKKS